MGGRQYDKLEIKGQQHVVVWSPALPQPPALELHPEEHLVKAELRKRAKSALIIQAKVRQSKSRKLVVVQRKRNVNERRAAVIIQTRARQRMTQLTYDGRRVHQALKRCRVSRRLLQRRTAASNKKIEAAPPSEPPISSAMGYWIDTLADNKIRLDGLCQDMSMLQVELYDARSTLRAGLDKMHTVVHSLTNESKLNIQKYGNVITVDTIRMRAPHMSPLAHSKGVQEVDMRKEAVNERWLYDP